MNRRLLLVGALLFCPGRAAHAVAQQSERVTAPFWRAVRDPGSARSQALLRQASVRIKRAARLLPVSWETVCRRIVTIPLSADNQQVRAGRLRALEELLPQARNKQEHLDEAVRLLQEAAEAAPDDPEVLHALARAQATWEWPAGTARSDSSSPCAVARKDEQAIETLERLRRLNPMYRASQVAFELGILQTRRRRYRQASEEYRKAIALCLDREDTAVMYANLGEVTMLAGDPEKAVAYYRQALDASGGGSGQLLALWGLAVSLDRLGEHETALRNAGRALDAQGGSMQILRSDGVFFEPEHEVHYYEALGHEALSRRTDAIRENALSASARSWRLFLKGAGAESRWSSTAAANLKRVESELASLKRRSGKKR